MRDKRYLLSRRRYDRFVRTDPLSFKEIDEAERRRSKLPPVFPFWQKLYLGSCFAVLMGMCIYAIFSVSRQPPPELSSQQLARDAAATERAAAFVTALGFKPGPAVCRALESGSAYCTVRVAGSDKTFALWCSWRHPTCIENMPRE